MSLKSLEEIPWFAVVGVVLLASMFINAPANIMEAELPRYLTQALLYIVLGWAFLKGYTKQGFTVFLMAGVWLLMQILCWAGIGSSLSASLWLLCIAQVGLTYAFFTNYPIKFAGVGGGSTWSYAALWVIFLFAVGKLWISVAYGTQSVQTPLWGIAILLLSSGYIVEPVEKQWATPLKAIGTLLAVVSALTISGAWLSIV